MKTIDINCDLGELPEALADGTQEALMRLVSSANISCGGHAGDTALIRATIHQALRQGVAVGAHPGFEDPGSFGRVELPLSPDEIAASVHRQLESFARIATECGALITHVKAHGALYNLAARDRLVARAFAQGVRRWGSVVTLFGLAGSQMLQEFRSAGFAVAAEAFADRAYEPDGSLRSRKLPGALLDSASAAAQAIRIACDRLVISISGQSVAIDAQTICIHGDSPGSPDLTAAVRRALTDAGFQIAPVRP